MAKTLIYDNDAKQKILSGIDKLEKATSVTLGPAGKNVIIDEYNSIHSTKDGVTVAKSIVLKDPFENLGANALREVAEKSNKNCGDGTTTSTLIAAEIYRNGLKHVSLGSNATQIKNGIKKTADGVVKILRNSSKSISSRDDIKKVCTVSANGDENIGNIIADVMDKIGNDGTIKVENGNTTEMTSKVVEGMAIDQGYISPYMVTKQDTMEVDYDQPYVLIVDRKLANLQELLPCLQSISQTGRPLLIIANEIQDDIIASLVVNNMRGSINVCAVKSPSFGENRSAILEDIAISVGGSVVSEKNGVLLEKEVVGGVALGQAKRVLVTKDKTVIFDGAGEQSEIDARISRLRNEIESCTSDYDKEKLQERLAKLASGIGIINVGADTEAERKELRDRVDDAFCAAKSAVKSGIVCGGGVALLKASKQIESDEFISSCGIDKNSDEIIGYKILKNSLTSPMRKILENAGLDASLIISKVADSNGNAGYDVVKHEYVDMLDDGIIDATDVVVNEVKNASSIAGLLLTTEALIVEEPVEKKSEASGMMPGMM